jgi:carboxyl-terminal processing protease
MIAACMTWSPADADTQGSQSAESCARHLWDLTEIVLSSHIDPCTRQEMILAAVKGLCKSANTDLPTGLSRRVSEIATREELTAFLTEILPKTNDTAGVSVEAEVLETALLGSALHALPDKPELIPPDQARTSEQLSGNRYVGTGIQLGVHQGDKLPQIINPFRQGAIRKAGAKPGDLIVAVDGKATHNAGLGKVVQWLRGEEGTPVTIVVRQPDAKETRTLNVIRGVVTIETVLGFGRVGENGWKYRIDQQTPIAYVRINALRSSTLHELRQAERQIRAEGARALILDLRLVGEGNLHHAELLADGLLDRGILWRLHEQQGKCKECKADPECLFRGWPLALLVNGFTTGTGPQAMIAALQDNGRAVVIGEPTKGDGYVSTRVQLPDGTGLVTFRTGRLERVGAKHRDWPVQPDHVVASKETHEPIMKWLRDKELPELPAGVEDKPPEDPQLTKAVEILKARLKDAPKNQKG